MWPANHGGERTSPSQARNQSASKPSGAIQADDDQETGPKGLGFDSHHRLFSLVVKKLSMYATTGVSASSGTAFHSKMTIRPIVFSMLPVVRAIFLNCTVVPTIRTERISYLDTGHQRNSG